MLLNLLPLLDTPAPTPPVPASGGVGPWALRAGVVHRLTAVATVVIATRPACVVRRDWVAIARAEDDQPPP